MPRNDETGIATLVVRMQELIPVALVQEASGGLEHSLAAAPAAVSLADVVVHPHQVRDFTRATVTLAKSDTLDAGVLAHFADTVRPEMYPLKDAESQALSSLATRRHQVMTMLVSATKRLGRRHRHR